MARSNVFAKLTSRIVHIRLYYAFMSCMLAVMDIIELGVTLKAARLAKGISQVDLCQSTLLSRSTLSAFENGRIAELGIGKILQLCSVLGLRLTIEHELPRPTLMQLVKERAGKPLPFAPGRKRAPRRAKPLPEQQ